jgi:outer membrane protein OmpA-like peptidoglycan-associated protein
MEAVQPKLALSELTKTREQVHALSRVEGASACDERKKAEPVPEKLTLAYSAYVEFEDGATRLIDINPNDLHQLDRLIEKLKKHAVDQPRMHLHLVGHVVELSNKKTNKSLVEARLQTVESYLVSQGVTAQSIQSEMRATTLTNKNKKTVLVNATVDK